MDVSYLAFRHHIRAFIDFILLFYVCVGSAISFGVRVFFTEQYFSGVVIFQAARTGLLLLIIPY